MSNQLAFLACVERGKLEAQTVLLCRSIRRFGGEYRDAPIYAFQPRLGRDIGEPTLAAFRELGVVHLPEILNRDFPDRGTINKIFACAFAERELDEQTLIFLDSDTVVIAEPRELDLPPGIDVAVRPADSDRLNSLGRDDAIDAFWRRVFHDRALADVPFVRTELGRRVRAFFSAGLIAVRRDAGVFREWEERFRYLVDRGIVPEGAFDRMDEIALVPTVVRRFAKARLLDRRYNYLLFKREAMVPPLRRLSLDQIVHLHYRFAFDQPDFLRLVRPPLDSTCPVFRWLERHLPLQATIPDTATPARVPTSFEAEIHAHR